MPRLDDDDPRLIPTDRDSSSDPSLARLDDAGHVTRLAERRRNRLLVKKALALAIDEAQEKLSEQTKREIVEATMKHLENG